MRPPPARPARTVESVLAHAHLRLGSLALARVELETMAGLGLLDARGLVDLAEVRWRTGDLLGAGEAASAALRDEDGAGSRSSSPPKQRPPSAARARRGGWPTGCWPMRRPASIAIFAGMPRSSVWPGDAAEPPPTAPTLFDREPDLPARVDANMLPSQDRVAPERVREPSTAAPVMLGFWDGEADIEPAVMDAPDPAAELDAGRTALVAGALDEAALHFGLALRVAPALAPAVLEATEGARSASLSIVRGDAYRLAGHEDVGAAGLRRGGPGRPARASLAGAQEGRSGRRQRPVAGGRARSRRTSAAPRRVRGPGSPIRRSPSIRADADGQVAAGAAAGPADAVGTADGTEPTDAARSPTEPHRHGAPTHTALADAAGTGAGRPDPAHPIQSRASSPTVPKVDMPGTERTLVLVKPDGVQRQLVGRIIARYEERGLKLVGLKLVRVDRDHAERHYDAHREKPFFAGLVEFIISGPLVALALDGPNAIAVVRAINGATRPHEAAPGTIRGDFALETAQNIVHASDSAESADVRARPVVRSRRAARLRARHRSLGARPERVGGRRARAHADVGASLAPGSSLDARGWTSGLGDGRLAGATDAVAGPSNAPAEVATASRPSSAATRAVVNAAVGVPRSLRARAGQRSRRVGSGADARPPPAPAAVRS